MGVRMIDIARDLGVSLMTVSKALRSHTDISAATRARVLKRARELDYRPNWIARSLVTRRTYVIGLVIPDLMHSFFAEVAKGVTRKFQPLGYQIIISNSEENSEVEEHPLADKAVVDEYKKRKAELMAREKELDEFSKSLKP